TADRHAIDPQCLAQSVIGLDQCSDGVTSPVLGNDPRRRACSALELVANHAGAATNIAFGDRPAAGRGIESSEGMFSCKGKALNLAQPPVIGLSNTRQQPLLWRATAHGERTDRVAHHADLTRVRDADRRPEQALLSNPWQASHLAVA